MIHNSESFKIKRANCYQRNTHLGWFTAFNKGCITTAFTFYIKEFGAEGSVHKENMLEIYQKYIITIIITVNHEKHYHYYHHL